jgi:predicted enzyme related to lactoylglutathione lyase
LKAVAAIFLAMLGLAARGTDLPPLNSVPTQEHFAGKFIWGDLFTSDPAGAQAFYTGLFGWTATTLQRTGKAGVYDYIVLSNGGRPIAGILKRPAKMADERHARWVGYVSVPNVPATLAAAAAGGGRVIFGAKNRPNRGDQGVFADPEGAMLGVIYSTTGDPGEFLPEVGDWTWSELLARDPGARPSSPRLPRRSLKYPGNWTP